MDTNGDTDQFVMDRIPKTRGDEEKNENKKKKKRIKC
jgi:hypothetical protein